MKPRKPPLHLLTSLRFFAALVVVLYHYTFDIGSIAPILSRLIGYGYMGVSFFFVLSGFILTYNYGDTRIVKKQFLIARIARIYPSYLLALVLSIPILVSYLKDYTFISAMRALGKFLLESVFLQTWIPGFGCGINCPGWSVAAEFFFYLLFPWIVLRIGKQRTAHIGLIAIVMYILTQIVPIMYVLFGVQANDTAHTPSSLLSFVLYNPFLHLPQFVIGVCCGSIFIRHQEWLISHKIQTILAWAAAVSVALLLVILASIAIPYPFVNNGLFAPLFGLLLIFFATYNGIGTKFFSGRVWTFLGEASYALYILQYPIAGLFSAIVFGKWQVHFYGMRLVLVYLVCLIGVAIGAFLLYEKPSRRLILSHSLWIAQCMQAVRRLSGFRPASRFPPQSAD